MKTATALTFGKHRGLTTVQIHAQNPSYISWLLSVTENEALREECVAVCRGEIGVSDSEREAGKVAFVAAIKKLAKAVGGVATLTSKSFCQLTPIARLAGILNLQDWNACFMDDTASFESDGVIYKLCYNNQKHGYKGGYCFSHHYAAKMVAA